MSRNHELYLDGLKLAKMGGYIDITCEDFVNGEPVIGHAVSYTHLDPEKAKQLLAEAGYPDGFEVTLDAPNDRYMNDEQIAQAVAGYLEKVGDVYKRQKMLKATFPTITVFPRPEAGSSLKTTAKM